MSTTIISVGNGGFNVASAIIKTGIFPDSQFIVVDTDQELLKKNAENADKSILLDKFGKGKVKSDLTSLVDKVLEGSSDTIIVCATLGGMTGTKYAPLISLNAILRGKTVCNVTTKPASFEGETKNKQAHEAWHLMMCTGNVVFLQYNNELNRLEDLMFGEMNKPLVATISNVLTGHTFEEVAKMNEEQLTIFMPKEYKLAGTPLIKISGDAYPRLTEADRKQLFDDLAQADTETDTPAV